MFRQGVAKVKVLKLKYATSWIAECGVHGKSGDIVSQGLMKNIDDEYVWDHPILVDLRKHTKLDLALFYQKICGKSGATGVYAQHVDLHHKNVPGSVWVHGAEVISMTNDCVIFNHVQRGVDGLHGDHAVQHAEMVNEFEPGCALTDLTVSAILRNTNIALVPIRVLNGNIGVNGPVVIASVVSEKEHACDSALAVDIRLINALALVLNLLNALIVLAANGVSGLNGQNVIVHAVVEKKLESVNARDLEMHLRLANVLELVRILGIVIFIHVQHQLQPLSVSITQNNILAL